MRSKYGAKKTQVDEIIFDSRAEAKRYRELMLLKRAGEVVEVVLQPSFTLMDGFTHEATGEKVRPLKYKADFLVTYSDGHQEIEDVKGFVNQTYAIKKKLFMDRYRHLSIKEIR